MRWILKETGERVSSSFWGDGVVYMNSDLEVYFSCYSNLAWIFGMKSVL